MGGRQKHSVHVAVGPKTCIGCTYLCVLGGPYVVLLVNANMCVAKQKVLSMLLQLPFFFVLVLVLLLLLLQVGVGF